METGAVQDGLNEEVVRMLGMEGLKYAGSAVRQPIWKEKS